MKSIIDSAKPPIAPMSEEESLTVIAQALAEISIDLKRLVEQTRYLTEAINRTGNVPRF